MSNLRPGTLRDIVDAYPGSSMAHRLLEHNMDPGVLRPFLARVKGKTRTLATIRDPKEPFITNAKGDLEPKYTTIVVNAPSLLRRDDWLRIDRAIQWQAKLRLKFWAQMRSKVPYDIPDYMGTIAIQHAVANGDADAAVSMDPVRKSERSRPVLKTTHVPLPIIHSDGAFTVRDMAVARKSGMPLDTTNMGLSARKVGEVLEQLAIGSLGTFDFAGGTLYGATNAPGRLTGTFTYPNNPGWTPKTMIDEILQDILQLENIFYFGPYSLYYSNDLGPYIDGDYQPYYASPSLRTRLEEIRKISEVTNLDYLPAHTMLLVQWTPDVCDALVGFDIQAVQWEEQGGMEFVFKVMTGQVPRFKVDFNGNTGIMQLTSTPTTTTTTTTTSTTTTT